MPFFRSRSTSSVSHLAGMMRVAAISYQWLLSDIASHLVISAHVTLRSWASELADTIVVDPMRVDSIQMTSQLTRADLPIPRPDATASRNVSNSILPLFCLMWSRRSRRMSRCHLRGPLKCSSGVPGSAHGNVSSTNASGSSLIAGDHSLDINSISPDAL